MNPVSRRDALAGVAAGAALAAAGAVAAGEGKEEKQEKHDLKRLEERIDLLSKSMAKMADVKDVKELITIIHKPGWTTPAEFALVAGIVDSMIAHADAMHGLKETLIKGSRAVGTV
jgi:hypothetical protein